ncbi:MAG: metallophosphoesterase [Alistipes sp.]|nr:metallophosphoesterase [Alistipes sp.]
MRLFEQNTGHLRYLSLLPAAWLAVACSAFEYHPYATSVEGETGINAKNIALIESRHADAASVRFAFLSDTQRWYDEAADAVADINRRGDIDFVIHGGDISDFGLRHEFEMQRDIFNRLLCPYVVLLGNHDYLGTGERVYAKIFGDCNFAFTAAHTRFICLDTNALEVEFAPGVPDLGFVEQELRLLAPDVCSTVMAMHVPPFAEEFNNDVAWDLERYALAFPSIRFCLYGHNHSLAQGDLFGDGVIYYGAPNIGKRIYYVFTLDNNGYEVEIVYY